MTVGPILSWLIRAALGRKAPVWLVDVLTVVLPETVDLVVDAIRDRRLDAHDTILRVQALLDDALDRVPGIRDEPEERRDVIIDGLVELSLLIYERASASKDDPVQPIQLRRAAKSIGRQIKREIREDVLEHRRAEQRRD